MREVFQSLYLTEGRETREFERRFVEYIGVKHGIATTSCTSGIELVLRATNIHAGDEVIVPDFTYPATALAVLAVGATPVIVDVSPDHFVVDVSCLRPHVTKNTRCILCVSNLGFPVDYEPIMDFARPRGIVVIEDAACSVGTCTHGKKAGSMVDAAVFSFHARKVITTGEGGMVCTNDDELAKRCSETKNFGVTGVEAGRQTFERWGTNLKMSNISAAIGLVQLTKLERIIQEREKRAQRYDDLLRDITGVEFIRLPEHVRYNHYCYPLLVNPKTRDQLIASLRERKIEAQIGSYALHVQPYFESLLEGMRDGEAVYPNSTRAFESILQLPLHHELTPPQQERVCQTLIGLVR